MPPHQKSTSQPLMFQAANSPTLNFSFISVVAISALVLSACGPSPEVENLRKQVDDLKQQLDTVTTDRDALKARVEDLSNTPTVLFANVAASAEAGNIEEAEKALNALKVKFPEAPEVKKAHELVDFLHAKIDKQREETRRLEAMGFKALKTTPLVDAGGVKVSVGTPSFSKQFVFDRYDTSYRYRDADRDHKYVVIGLSATAAKGVSDPNLPGFALYWADGKELRRVSEFDLQFVRWEDYATYLGNYHDSRNDFAKNATIPFTMGAHVTDRELAKRPLYVVATTMGCQSRSYERFRNPPVYYFGACMDLAEKLPLDSFVKENSKLTLVRRID
jgi:hypothetical protein